MFLTLLVGSTVAVIANKTVTEGDNVTLYCNASGTPEPSVVWSKEDSGFSKGGTILTLNNINRTNSGKYKCEASNVCKNSSESLLLNVECE